MISNLVEFAVAALAVFILGLSKGGFSGIGMVSTPLLTLVVPAPAAAGILLPIMVFQDVVSVIAYRKSFDRRNLMLLLPGAIVGIVLAALTISVINRSLFEITLGLISIVFGIERICSHFGPNQIARNFGPAVGAICGAIAGFTSMIANAGLPPFQYFVMPQRLPRDVYVGTSVMFYAAVNAIKLPFFLSLGQVTVKSAQTSLELLPLAVLAVLLGIWMVRRVPNERYSLIANIVLVAIGFLLLVRGWTG